MPRLRSSLALAAALALVVAPRSGANAQHKRVLQPVVFAAPAGDRPAGAVSSNDVFDPTLPSGRLLRPAGASVVVGTNALGFALSPDGRFAIVSNDDEHAGSSLAVVDTASMSVVSRYADPADSFYAGVVALADPANPANTLVLASGGPNNVVYALDLDASGTLTPDAHPSIAIPPPADARVANAGHAYPGTLVIGANGTRAYVVNGVGDDVAQIDVAARALAGPSAPVGFFPFGAAVTAGGLLVANEGLTSYGVLPAPAASPPFANVAPDLARASSLSLLPLAGDGSLAPAAVNASIPLDRTPDGVHAVGGAHPVAVVPLHRRPLAFVALSNVDRVATIALAPGAPHAVGGTELRLYDRGPYGTQPTALALAKNEKRLYVALAGIDAVAVLDTTDPLHPHRVGLIPTGWYPDALALSADERYLFVANADGMNADGGRWSTFERIDLRRTDLRRSTPVALAALRTFVQPRVANPIVPQRFSSRGSTAIKHVVVIVDGSETYDAMLGDLTDGTGASYGPGDPALVTAGETITPNLHALARTYGLAGNFYADADDADVGRQFAFGGIASAYTERTALGEKGRGPATDANEDPEDYPRAGYVWNSLADHGRTYRDYGDLLRVAGYDAGSYPLDVPAPAALLGHVDLAYPPFDARTRDTQRAAEFVRDFTPLAQTDTLPAFTEVWLPGDAAAPNDAADGDRALGSIVDFLSHTSQWNDMAIVVMPAAAGSARDHVDARRTYAIVVSPFAKRHYLGMRHQSTAGALKTEEEMLGLPALSLGDELATDMSDFFTPVADRTPFAHVDVPAVPGGAGHSAPNTR